jgi:hypothetical protein
MNTPARWAHSYVLLKESVVNMNSIKNVAKISKFLKGPLLVDKDRFIHVVAWLTAYDMEAKEELAHVFSHSFLVRLLSQIGV